MTALGVFAFGDFHYHKWNAVGICISMGGAIWYATRAALRVSLQAIATHFIRLTLGKTLPPQQKVITSAELHST